MSTYGTLKTRVASEILRTAWADTFVQNAVLDAIEDFKFTRFRFNTARFTLNTVADQEYYDLPDDLLDTDGNALATGETLLEIDGMACRYNNAAYPIEADTDAELELETTSNTRGQPACYSWTGTQLRFTPIPDQAYAVWITGLKQLSTLSASGDTNAWMTDGAALIRARAKVRLYRDILRDTGMVANAQAEEDNAMLALTRGMEAQQPMRLQAWGY